MDGDPIFEVEKILDSRIRKVGSRRVTEYKIRWANFPPIHDSWEPSKNIIDKNLIKDFLSGSFPGREVLEGGAVLHTMSTNMTYRHIDM